MAEITEPKKGQAVWLIVNQQAQLRYFVEFYDGSMSKGARLSFEPDLSGPVYYEYPTFFEKRSDILRRWIESKNDRLRRDLLVLTELIEDLVNTLDDEANDSVTGNTER